MTRVRLAVVFVAVVALMSALGAQVTPQSPTPPDDFLKGVYASDTKDLVVPVALREVKPKYTAAAMRAKIQGMIKVQVVVMADGTVDRARILKGLHTELDANAIDAAKRWLFTPGRLQGAAVPVAMDLGLEFRLH